MAADLQQLDPGFLSKVESLLVSCTNEGITMRPNESVRTPFKQARLWRQSRSKEQINQKVSDLRNSGADFLAFCIESVGPQHGAHVTNAIPGFSWHQWGEALDCFWLVDGQAEWSVDRLVNGKNGYRVYAEKADELDLEVGGFWSSIKDWPHVQLRGASNPSSIFSLHDINKRMKEQFE